LLPNFLTHPAVISCDLKKYLVQMSNNENKRYREVDSPDAAGGLKRDRVARVQEAQAIIVPEVDDAVPAPPQEEASLPNMNPYPFFSYNDFSTIVDPDSLTPLTSPGRVPNFTAKMHSILSRPELADIVCWLPHGRSWRILKQSEFEVGVIPAYFEHAKYSSFIRQANGWGFRRVTQGRGRNSYYHELFLRGLPHLCKDMKRPGVLEKRVADPQHEPDFYKISEMHPVPEKSEDDSILLQCTIHGGPKARMPIYSGACWLSSSSEDACALFDKKPPAAPVAASLDSKLTPSDSTSLASFQHALETFELGAPSLAQPVALPHSHFASITQVPVDMPVNIITVAPEMTTLATANQLAFANPNKATAAFQANSVTTQFAAGFAAATALSQQQFRAMLDSYAAAMVSAQAAQQSQSSAPHNIQAPAQAKLQPPPQHEPPAQNAEPPSNII
jgi:hypothetical protein